MQFVENAFSYSNIASDALTLKKGNLQCRLIPQKPYCGLLDLFQKLLARLQLFNV